MLSVLKDVKKALKESERDDDEDDEDDDSSSKKEHSSKSDGPERAHGLIKMRTMDPVQKSIVRKLVSLIVVWKLV